MAGSPVRLALAVKTSPHVELQRIVRALAERKRGGRRGGHHGDGVDLPESGVVVAPDERPHLLCLQIVGVVVGVVVAGAEGVGPEHDPALDLVAESVAASTVVHPCQRRVALVEGRAVGVAHPGVARQVRAGPARRCSRSEPRTRRAAAGRPRWSRPCRAGSRWPPRTRRRRPHRRRSPESCTRGDGAARRGYARGGRRWWWTHGLPPVGKRCAGGDVSALTAAAPIDAQVAAASEAAPAKPWTGPRPPSSSPARRPFARCRSRLVNSGGSGGSGRGLGRSGVSLTVMIPFVRKSLSPRS